MLVEFYKIAMFACINAVVPNREFVAMMLPAHQQAYIIQGANAACRKELKTERLMACTEQADLCTNED